MAAWKKAALFIAVAAAGAVVLVLLLGGEEPTPAPAPASAKHAAEIPADVVAERGPRPDVSRLPQGVHQVEDPGEALRVAQDALHRVETELAAAPDAQTRNDLERKKRLIERSLERLGRQE